MFTKCKNTLKILIKNKKSPPDFQAGILLFNYIFLNFLPIQKIRESL